MSDKFIEVIEGIDSPPRIEEGRTLYIHYTPAHFQLTAGEQTVTLTRAEAGVLAHLLASYLWEGTPNPDEPEGKKRD